VSFTSVYHKVREMLYVDSHFFYFTFLRETSDRSRLSTTAQRSTFLEVSLVNLKKT
jgi:hypothetical protein